MSTNRRDGPWRLWSEARTGHKPLAGGAKGYVSLPAPNRSAPHPVSSLEAGTPTVAHRRLGRLGRLIAVAAFLLLMTAAGSSAFFWFTTPSASDLAARVAAMAPGGQLQPAQVPQVLEHAVVAAEDERFYVHHGLDTVGTGRAIWDDVSRLCACEGGSTVTQQLAKLVYYPDDGRLARKLPSVALAFKIELRYSKAQIIAAYLSVVPTGYGLVGATAASCRYFGHDLSSLSVAEAAELAGMVQGPSAYDPRYHPAKARARRDYAIERMLEVGYITQDEARIAKAAPVVIPGTGCRS